MVAMLDTDHSGKLGLLELKTLLGNIFKWNTVFRTHDIDKSGHLSSLELRDALNGAGFKLNNRILTALCHRYSSRDGFISYVDFITCAVKIKTMIGIISATIFIVIKQISLIILNPSFVDIFKDRDIDGQNVTSFTIEDWLAMTIY